MIRRAGRLASEFTTQSIDRPIAPGEANISRRRIGKSEHLNHHRLIDGCAPGYARIERGEVVVPGELQAVRVHQSQHGVQPTHQHNAVDVRHQLFASFERDPVGIDITGLVQPTVDGLRQGRDRLCFGKMIIGLDLHRFARTADHQNTRFTRAFAIEQPDQSGPHRRVWINRHHKFAFVRLRQKGDARRVHPHLRRPGIELADDAHRVGGARGESRWMEVFENWRRRKSAGRTHQ